MTRLSLEKPIVSTFVDDIKIMGPKYTRVIARVITELVVAFVMVNIRSINFYLGFKAKCN